MTLALEQEPIASEETSAEQKRKEGYEAASPELEQHAELTKDETFVQGGRWYYALERNSDGYAKWHNESKRIIEKNKEVLAEAAEKYKEIADEEPEWAGKLAWIDSDHPEKLLSENAEEGLKRERYLITEDPQRPGHMSKIPGKTYEQTERPLSAHMLVEMKIQDYDFYSPNAKPRDTHLLVRGAGVAALQSRDVELAGKALAFAESVEPASSEMKQRIENMLSKLSPEEQEEYERSYQKEIEARNS